MSTDLQKTPPTPVWAASRPRLVPPYDNGKVKIGLAYVLYQSWRPSRDMYDLQTALLGPRSSIRTTWPERFVHRLSNLLSLRRHTS